MARTRKVPSERQVELPADERQEQDDGMGIVEEKATLAVAAGFGKLSGLLGEQAVKCMLRRRDEDSKKWEFQETFPVEDFSFEYVRDVFGGGEYQIQALDDSGDYVKSFTFHIDHRYKGKRWGEGQPSVAAGSGEGPTWIAAALDKMSEAIRVMAERKPDPPPMPPPAPDPMAMIEKLAVTMRALAPPPAPAGNGLDMEKQLNLIEKVVNVGTSIIEARGEGGGGGSGDAYMGVVSRLAEPVIELVKTQAARERLRPTAPRRALSPPGIQEVTALQTGRVPEQQPVVASAPAGGASSMPWLLEVQRWVPLIVKRQQKGLSAESTAFFVCDELSEGTLSSLAQFLAQDGADAQIKTILPAELQNDPVWTDEFLAAVHDYLFADDDEQEDGAPEGGVIDLAAEADRRLKKLQDNPDVKPPEQQQ